MLVGGVIGDVVEDNFQVAAMRLRYQRVEVGQRAEQRVNVGVVGDIVAKVGHRR